LLDIVVKMLWNRGGYNDGLFVRKWNSKTGSW